MEKRDLKYGDVVQIDPAHEERFGGCFLLVTELKGFGCQGFVKMPGGGLAYYRVSWANMEYIGPAAWAPPEREEEKKDEPQETT